MSDQGDQALHVLQSLGPGVALAEPGTWRLLMENARFFQLYSPSAEGGETLTERIEELPVERASERLAERRSFSFETEVETGGPATPLRVELRLLDFEGEERILVEVYDISKEKEVQYMLDSYSRLAERNARQLEKEKDRVEKLLLNIMPRAVFEELKDFGTTTPQNFESASILMLDFVGFTKMAIANDPSAIISELNDIFSAFDQITEMFGSERLRTIGDAYMAVSGVPEPVPDHAHNIARVALRMRRYLERRNAAHPQNWRARIGIHTGPVIGSLVGIQKYVYDLFGPGVNFAARMEGASEPMKITLNQDTYELLKDDFVMTPRGETEIKGFGTHELFFLEAEAG